MISWVLAPIRCNNNIILKKTHTHTYTQTHTDNHFPFKWELEERKDNRKVCLVMCNRYDFGN